MSPSASAIRSRWDGSSGRASFLWVMLRGASSANRKSRDTRRRFGVSVIDPGGQTVCARDRLYLAGDVPTMIVWGDRDDIIPVEHAYAAHALIPGSRLESFEGAGHFLHVEHPLRFAELLRDFME